MSIAFLARASEASTLVELLRWRALHEPDKLAYSYIVDGKSEEVQLSYGELDRKARAIAARLHSLMDKGQQALLLYPAGLEFVAAFFGCLYAGAVAVPACLPESARLKHAQRRLQDIVSDAQTVVAMTTAKALPFVESLFDRSLEAEHLQWLVTDDIDCALAAKWREPRVGDNNPAFLQYTSGSTASPRGVIVSHRNVLANLALICRYFENSSNSRGVIWLPHYHDMGLIGGILQPLYGGFPVTLMSPMTFLLRPFRWLQSISRTRATISGGPNFAYDLCVRKITPEQRTTLDLTSWQVAFTGSEPIRAETIDRFVSTFASSGFRRDAFYPCYGLAEATLFVTGGGARADRPISYALQKTSLEQNKVIAASDDKDALSLIGCGELPSELEIAIVDPERAVRCTHEQVGEIWVSGPSVSNGYWDRAEETEHTFRAYLADTGEGPFLRTGDLGFVKQDNLFVTGRLKDLIIIAGRNHYPQDIERTVETSHPALRLGSCIAFSIDSQGEEQLVVLAEVDPRYRQRQISPDSARTFGHDQDSFLPTDEIVGAIRQAVAEFHDIQVHEVLLLKRGNVPKTTSGKIQRSTCRSRFLEGSIQAMDSIQP